LQRSEHKAVILMGDLAALASAVLVSLWIWSITAGFPFSTVFVADHAIWFAAVPVWRRLMDAPPARHGVPLGPVVIGALMCYWIALGVVLRLLA